jgi:hypothetical protein
MGQNFFDGTKVDTNTLIEVVGGKGTDSLAHPFQLDANGKLYVNVSGIVAGALLYTSDSVAVGIVGAASTFARPATSGNNLLIAAQALKTITVLGYRLQASNAVGASTITAYFADTAGTPAQLSQTWEFQAREGAVATAPPGGFEFQASVGLGLQLNLSASQPVSVGLIYTQV